ncbi:MAG: hypothetical protein DWQ28_06660 [Proteobacteria bacterium]|nr:MAG: hypothetical protein DWQ28_06355 [Pseudomonadota bacterium]REJ67713.1 MAG: hypothetical protein DWQ28_06660 [Pseudomonadota bacterium]
MGKGGGGTRTIQNVQQTMTDPTTAPFKEFALSEAKRLYEAGPQQFYPGETVVGFRPETEMALSGLRQKAITGSPFIGAVQDVVMQNLTGTNPLMSAAFQPVIEQVEAEASKAGRYGSAYQQGALGKALAPMALELQQRAIQQAPAARQLGFADLETLAGVGAAQEAQEQMELASDIERFQFEQQAPQVALANYLASVQGGQLGSQTITPYYTNPLASGLSGALGGASMAGQAGFNPMYGAIAGGLSGLLA